ncbi:hypothetical protein LTR46_007510 [Exophiala xenobiotica]|nr:hypothetical protein LTR46_007510 [Exophiala xenobiotica]
MSRQCTISEPFRREHKRKRISELELRTDELQERLNTSSQRDTSALPEPTWTAVNSSDHQNVESESRLASVAPFFRDAAIAPVSFRSFSQAAETLQTPESLPHDQSPAGTLPRTLEGQTVDAKDIDALFQTYFRDYASLMPILEPSMTPNACYTLSSFLFWAIIGVGCRTCHNNPTLLGVLPPKIHKMALLSVNGNGSLQTVQAWLLLLYWPFPKSNTGQDLIFPMSAAILHMAMQLGLHLPSSGQEFSKVRLRLSEEEMRMRAETWGYCTLIYQRSCVAKGMPATPILDIPYDLEQRRALFQNMSPRLKFELKLQDVVTRGSIAVSQNGLRVMSAEQERSLDTLLNVFQAQIAGVGLEYASDLDRLYVQLSTQSILAYNLYKSPAAQDPTSLYDLCMTCCQVIESFDHLDRIGQICLAASPIFFYHGLMVPCHILLRLLKTSFSRYITIERAKTALFLGISLHKRMSLQNDDVPARSGVALTQLWNSTRVFRKPNGSETVALRIRSRLSGSIVLDGIVWWREEFGAFMGVYPPPITDARNDPPPNEHGIVPNGNALPEATMPAPAKPDYSNFLDDPMLTEFGWPIQYKYPDYPVASQVNKFARGLLVIDQPTANIQCISTMASMGRNAGFTTKLLTHDIRRGAAKDLSRIPKSAMITSGSGVARAMGHRDKTITSKYYNPDEDLPLNTLKPAVKLGRVDTRIPQATAAYQKPHKTEITELINQEIIANGDEVVQNSTRGLQFFLGTRPQRGEDGFMEHRLLREKMRRRILAKHLDEWAQRTAASKELPPSKKQKFSDFVSAAPTPLRTISASEQNRRDGASDPYRISSASTSEPTEEIPIDPRLFDPTASAVEDPEELEGDTLITGSDTTQGDSEDTDMTLQEIEEIQQLEKQDISRDLWELLEPPDNTDDKGTDGNNVEIGPVPLINDEQMQPNSVVLTRNKSQNLTPICSRKSRSTRHSQ